ncbi:ABC transporter ATP-binding protein [Sphaerimonospora thailandensis]|uniref:ABC transporter ATP-binding protein n=1 Tax=Sphaerimonospora thailandensis TaxID=795644 RepID=A0A8J3W1I4_9ACTN|nr:ABC transporter ATP-binding protein [Sphaerimonospora thailandensis]GIH72230.1 ABC transporter ATP-binding protein [Sphaerimonospora thailandensis]
MTISQEVASGIESAVAVAPVVELEDVTKAFGTVQAVRGVTLSVAPGQVYGVLGPNGAGKTTLLRILLGLVRSDRGRVRVLGRAPADPVALRDIGALIESPAFVPHLSGRVNLRVLARARGLPATEVGRVLRIVDLENAADRRVTGYSLGMRQRLGVAAALLGDPSLLILDEPTNGLDPEGMAAMRTLIRDLSRVSTVLLSSHLLGEVQQVCDRVVVLDRGRVVAEDSVSALLAQSGSMRVAVWGRPLDVAETVLKSHPAWSGAIRTEDAEDPHLRLELDQDDIPALVRALVEAGVDVQEVRREHRSLEEAFFALTTDAGSGE